MEWNLDLLLPPMIEQKSHSSCILCSESHLEYEFKINGNILVRCQNCNFLFINPPPDEHTIERILMQSNKNNTGRTSHGNKSIESAQSYVANLRRYTGEKRSKFFDYLGGDQLILKAAQKAGFEVTALAPNEATADEMNIYLNGEPVYSHSWWSLDKLPAGQDVFVMRNKLHYFADPIRTLKHIHSLLNPEGVLHLTVPSLDSSQARSQKQNWADFQSAHLHYFDSQTIQYALVKSGYHSIHIEPDSAISGKNDKNAGGIRVFCRSGVLRDRPLLSVVVPVFNEKNTFSTLMDKLLPKQIEGIDKEVIIVESNSTDGTKEDVEKYRNSPEVTIISEERPRGKGRAVRTGFMHAQGDYIIIQDGDLEYDVNDYDMLLKPLTGGKAAFVLGTRYGKSWKIRQFQQYFLADILNYAGRFMVAVMNLLFRQSMTDPFSMFKVFRKDCLYGLRFECNGFNFDVELVSKLIRKGYIPHEVTINYNSRSFAEGKKVKFFSDPPKVMAAMFKYRFKRAYYPETEFWAED